MNDKKFKCQYCGKDIHKIDYELNNGYCNRCKEILEWKRTIDHMKDFKK